MWNTFPSLGNLIPLISLVATVKNWWKPLLKKVKGNSLGKSEFPFPFISFSLPPPRQFFWYYLAYFTYWYLSIDACAGDYYHGDSYNQSNTDMSTFVNGGGGDIMCHEWNEPLTFKFAELLSLWKFQFVVYDANSQHSLLIESGQFLNNACLGHVRLVQFGVHV